MNKEDLKKSTCINLRCVTQSAKGGVPLNQLQSDYKQLLGTPIPFKDLGYNSFESFLHDIPDVIHLKKNADGSMIAEGVADASTAHIAKLISKQKSSKKSKSGSAKPSVCIRTRGGVLKKSTFQNFKPPLRDSNSVPPSTLVRNHDQNSKLMPLTPHQQELKKSVLINLRSLVLSSKDGVPVNRLQRDYKKFIGSFIPFENLGYNTLSEFIQSIPEVINLKKDAKGEIIAVGVVDSATAHLFGNTLMPKPLKSGPSPTEPFKPFVKNRPVLQISSEQKVEPPAFFKLPQDLELPPAFPPTNGSKENKFINSVSQMPSKSEDRQSSTEELKSEPLKAAKPVISCKENSTPEFSLSGADDASPQNQNQSAKKSNQYLPSAFPLQTVNRMSTMCQWNKEHSSISAIRNSIDKARPLCSCCNSFSESYTQFLSNGVIQLEKGINCIIPDKSSNQKDQSSKSSCSSVVDTENKKPRCKKNPVNVYSKRARKRAKEIQDQIKIAPISPLVWMHFVIYGPSTMEALKEQVSSFYGFPFSEDSKEWREKVTLLSLMPKKALRQCAVVMGIEVSSKDTEGILQDKLINYLANFTKESNTNTFDAKPATSNVFGSSTFGVYTPSAPMSSRLFGSTTPASGTGLFGQPSTAFGAQAATRTGGFGEFNTTAPAGTIIKCNPPTGIDTMMKGGVSTRIGTRLQCITCMKEYKNKSLEELRVEDYATNRKRGSTTGITNTNAQEIKQEDCRKELHASTVIFSSVSSDVLSKCSSCADTETSDAMRSDKNRSAPKTKPKILSDSDSGFAESPPDNVLKKGSNHLEGKKKAIQAEKNKDRANSPIENCKGIQNKEICEVKLSSSTKSTLQKQTVAVKVTPVLQKQHPLNKNSVEQNVDSGECSPERTLNLVSSKRARKRAGRKQRKAAELAAANNEVPEAKPVEDCLTMWQVKQMIKLRKEGQKRKLLRSSTIGDETAT